MIFVLILHIVWGNTTASSTRVAEYASRAACTDAGGQAIKDSAHWKRSAEIDYLCVAVPTPLPALLPAPLPALHSWVAIPAGGPECASYVCPSCAPAGHIIAAPDVVDVKTAPGARGIKP